MRASRVDKFTLQSGINSSKTRRNWLWAYDPEGGKVDYTYAEIAFAATKHLTIS